MDDGHGGKFSPLLAFAACASITVGAYLLVKALHQMADRNEGMGR
jgi:hypothetical protein